jgi:L-fuconolactonase
LAEFGYTYDLLIYPRQLQEAVGFVRQFPEQKFVLDHMAKPLIREGSFEPWKKYIVNLASSGNIYCKLSGMVTEADWKKWKPADFRPYLDVVFTYFGPQRLLYGSDWPVCLLASTYPQQLAIVEDYINTLSPSEKQRIMGENAVQFYNL